MNPVNNIKSYGVSNSEITPYQWCVFCDWPQDGGVCVLCDAANDTCDSCDWVDNRQSDCTGKPGEVCSNPGE